MKIHIKICYDIIWKQKENKKKKKLNEWMNEWMNKSKKVRKKEEKKALENNKKEPKCERTLSSNSS